MAEPRFEIFRGKDEQFYFRLKAANNKIIASSEGYLEKSSCVAGISALQKVAAEANTVMVMDKG